MRTTFIFILIEQGHVAEIQTPWNEFAEGHIVGLSKTQKQ